MKEVGVMILGIAGIGIFGYLVGKTISRVSYDMGYNDGILTGKLRASWCQVVDEIREHLSEEEKKSEKWQEIKKTYEEWS